MLEIKKITKTYGIGETSFQALRGVTFSIEEGEYIAIMGPSGSGKSTLMHILGCLDTPTSGEYFLDAKDVSTLTDDELADIRKQHIGFVFHSTVASSASVFRRRIWAKQQMNWPFGIREISSILALMPAICSRSYAICLPMK